jgi:hypothetical protein
MREFPSLPNSLFEWFSVAWEPIALSEERLIAFVVVTERGTSTRPHIHRCITDRQVRCLFGEGSGNVSALLEFAQSLLTEQLSISGDLEANFGFSGFSLGRKGFLNANNQLEAVRVAICEASLFGTTALTEFADRVLQATEEQTEHINAVSEDRFFQMVQKLVTEQSPQLHKQFHKSFKLTENARDTKIDFAGSRLFANLHRLKPGRTLTQQLKYGKQKLLDLSSLRLWLDDQKLRITGETHTEFELLTHRPKEESIDYSLAEIKQVNEAVEELTYAADHHDLRLRLYDSPDAAAKRILEAEA